MNSMILRTATRYMYPLLMLYSVYLFLRGHHYPGGGFVGGLSAGAAFALYALAFDVQAARRLLGVSPLSLTACGLAVALGSGIFAWFSGMPYMTSRWIELAPIRGLTLELGTPLLFDLGVYLVVLGVILTIIFALAEEE